MYQIYRFRIGGIRYQAQRTKVAKQDADQFSLCAFQNYITSIYGYALWENKCQADKHRLTSKVISYPSEILLQVLLNNFFVQHDIFFLNDDLFVIMSEKPGVEPAPLPHFFKEIRQGIPLVQPAVKVPTDQHNIVFGQGVLFTEAFRLKTPDGLIFLIPPENNCPALRL